METIRKVFALPNENESSYRKPLRETLSSGSIPERIFQMQTTLSHYPGRPTDMNRQSVKEIKHTADLLSQDIQIIINSDHPELNKFLQENNEDNISFPTIT